MGSDFLADFLSTLKFFTRDFDDMPTLDPNKPLPEFATIREVDIVPNGNSYDFKFSGYADNVPVASPTALEQILVKLYAGTLPLTRPATDPVWPYGSFLSLNNKGYVYIIYVLSPTRNWQFARKKTPITVSKSAYPKQAYFNSTKVKADGKPADLKRNVDDLRIAYIIADANAAFEEHSEYVDRINLHVDMKYRGPSPGYEPLFMPLIIDPDIRYPGGSGG